MAPEFVSYSTDNDRIFRNYLTAASKNTGDLRRPFGLILRDFYRSEKAIFKLKGPGQYPDLAESTKKQKQRQIGQVYPILYRTGKLAASLLSDSADGSVAKISPLSLVIGTTIEYGIYHQSDEPRKVLPLRKFLFIGPEAPQFATSDQEGRLKRWVGYLQDHMMKQVLNA